MPPIYNRNSPPHRNRVAALSSYLTIDCINSTSFILFDFPAAAFAQQTPGIRRLKRELLAIQGKLRQCGYVAVDPTQYDGWSAAACVGEAGEENIFEWNVSIDGPALTP